MVQTCDEFPLFGRARNSWIERRIQDHLGLLERRELMPVAQELKEPHITRQIRFAHAPKYPQIGLQQ